MEVSDKWFQTFKACEFEECGVESKIIEVLGAICISRNMGNESLYVPTREPTAIELARYEKQ